MQSVEHAQRNNKDDPPPGRVEIAFGLVRVPILDEQSGSDDADIVGDDRDGHGGKNEQAAHPEALFQKISVDDSERYERHERANAAAGLGHFERHGSEVDDVA